MRKFISICFGFITLLHSSVYAEKEKGIFNSKEITANRPVKSANEIFNGTYEAWGKGVTILPVDEYKHTQTIVYTDHEQKELLTVKLWNKTFKRFPGCNPPIAEVFKSGVRTQVKKLNEVIWNTAMWSATMQGTGILYIEGIHRCRKARGIYAYHIDVTAGKLVYRSVVFTKIELEKERVFNEKWHNKSCYTTSYPREVL